MSFSFSSILSAAVLSIAAVILPVSSSIAQDASVIGTWLTEKGDAQIRVTQCGVGICGRVASLREPIDPQTGKPQVDDKNPNPSLADRPMIGINLFNNMRPVGPGRWEGSIYNADDGQFYASKVTLQSPTALRVEGCVGALCGGETWTRADR
jgi:uncharacterized protein (DUF2147 family)